MYTLSLTSALDSFGWSTPRPDYFSPKERPGTHCTEGWVGPRASRDGCGKSRPPLGIDSRNVQPVESRCTHYAVPSHSSIIYLTVSFSGWVVRARSEPGGTR